MTIPPAPTWTAAIALAATAALAGFLLGQRARFRRLRLREDEAGSECVAIALLAAEAGDHARALHWFRHARDLAPENARLAAQEAWCLAELGRVDEALEAYAEASALSRDGLADFDAALLLLREGRSAAQAEERLAKALRRTPELALEAQGMDEFLALRGRGAYEDEMRAAQERLREPRRLRRR